MNKEDIIRNLEEIKENAVDSIYSFSADEKKEAIDEAIEALENQTPTGFWEAPDPDYDRDGFRLPNHVAICSNCQKPNRLPVGRFCSECGSYNANE